MTITVAIGAAGAMPTATATVARARPYDAATKNAVPQPIAAPALDAVAITFEGRLF